MASALGSGYFSVHVRSRVLITAESQLPESWLPLSNLDLVFPPIYPSFFIVYKKSNIHCEFGSVIGTLKKALSKLLVPYYPLAGVMVTNQKAEPELHCNNRGVEFIEAYADVELPKLDLHHPDDSLRGKLVPCTEGGILALQVTEMKCRSVVVSCTFDHRIGDGYSINMFLEAWAEMSRTGTMSVTPSFRRSLLSPRWPLSYGKSIDDAFVVLPSPLSPPLPAFHDAPSDLPANKIYYMSAQDMDRLQVLANNQNGSRRTKLEALSGCLWKAVAKSAHDGESCKLGIFMDGRSRLIEDGGLRVAMPRYFGNVLSLTHGEIDAKELAKMPFGWVSDRVHELLGPTTTKEYFLGLLDWLEANRPLPVVPRVWYKGMKDGPSFMVSHGRFLQVEKMDFGWGRPILGSCYFPSRLDVGYVMPVPGASENGDWVIFMSLFRHQLDLIEAELGDGLHPLSLEHLNLNGN